MNEFENATPDEVVVEELEVVDEPAGETYEGGPIPPATDVPVEDQPPVPQASPPVEAQPTEPVSTPPHEQGSET